MSWASKVWKSTKKHAKKSWHSAGDKLHDAGNIVGDFASDFGHHLDVYTGIKDLIEADNPWNEFWDQTGEGIDIGSGGALANAMAKNDWLKDDYAKYTSDAGRLGAAAVIGVAGTMYGGPVGYGAAMGVMSGTGINAYQQKQQTGHIDWGNVGMAGVRGGVTGAAGGMAGSYMGDLVNANSWGTAIGGMGGESLAGAVQSAGIYGGSGFGSAYGETGDAKFAAMYGLASAAGGMTGAALGGGGALSTSALLGAASGGLGILAAGGGDDGGGGGGGGNYQAPQSQGVDPNGGGKKQSSAGKSVPEAEFLDGGGANWGNGGMGGVFGGLDNMRNKDKFVNTDDIKALYAQRGVGSFVK